MPDARQGHHRRANHTRNRAAPMGRRENVFPPRRLSWGTNHRPPSIHGVPARAASWRPATYVISVIELPLFSCHGCSDASLLPALGRRFYPPRRVHHSTGPTIAAGEVCRTGHNLRRRGSAWCPWGNGSALLAREISRLSDAFNRGFARNCVPVTAGRTRPGLRLSAGPNPTPRGAARRPRRPRRRPGPAPW